MSIGHQRNAASRGAMLLLVLTAVILAVAVVILRGPAAPAVRLGLDAALELYAQRRIPPMTPQRWVEGDRKAPAGQSTERSR